MTMLRLRLASSSPITFTSPSSEAHQKSGPFARPRRSYDPVRLPPWPPPVATLRPLPSPLTGLPRLPEPPFQRAAPTTPADRALLSIASPLIQPSPNGRRVGIRVVTFEACSGFTHIAARRIARSPKATFVTRLQPGQLPSRAARQLPDLSTIIRVEPSSTDDSRLRGALPDSDMTGIKPFAYSSTSSVAGCEVPNDPRS